MKTNLKMAVAAILLGLFLAAAPAIAQTSVKNNLPVLLPDEPITGESSAQGALVLGAGGSGRVIARIGVAGPNLLRLQLANLLEYQTRIALLEADGTERWSHAFSGEAGFAKLIDLKALTLEPGSYSLWVQAGEAYLEQKLVVKNRQTILGPLHYGAVNVTAAKANN